MKIPVWAYLATAVALSVPAWFIGVATREQHLRAPEVIPTVYYAAHDGAKLAWSSPETPDAGVMRSDGTCCAFSSYGMTCMRPKDMGGWCEKSVGEIGNENFSGGNMGLIPIASASLHGITFSTSIPWGAMPAPSVVDSDTKTLSVMGDSGKPIISFTRPTGGLTTRDEVAKECRAFLADVPHTRTINGWPRKGKP